MMQYSINEIEVLLSKSARGGGAPAGQASAFGKAAVLHIARGCDAADIHAALHALPDGPIVTYPAQLQQQLSQGGGDVTCTKGDLKRSYALALPYLTLESDSGVSIDMTGFEKFKLPARVSVADDLVAACRTLAALTYVPETEQSRHEGAGAGLTDND